MKPSVVFDFDGTLCLGHGPVFAYAREAALGLTHAATADSSVDLLDLVEAELSAYDRGKSDYRDGYDVVVSLAKAAGVTDAHLATAYQASRESLGTAAAPTETMPELREFLRELGHRATLVLATNAPNTGIDRVLEQWDVTDLFDEQHFGLGKPAGLSPLVERLLTQGPVLSIGDIYQNDLAPAHAQGADTALVGAKYQQDHPGLTMRAPTLHDLRVDITTWARANSSSKLSASTDAEETIER